MQVIAQDFWVNVDVKSVNACWEWQRGCTPDGYGKLWDGKRKKKVLAHRYAYELTHGAIPIGLCICHSCDNRLCCNPNHLWVGTQAENMHDMSEKGRSKTCGRRKPITPLMINEICSQRIQGMSTKEIAACHSLSLYVVQKILRREPQPVN